MITRRLTLSSSMFVRSLAIHQEYTLVDSLFAGPLVELEQVMDVAFLGVALADAGQQLVALVASPKGVAPEPAHTGGHGRGVAARHAAVGADQLRYAAAQRGHDG